MPQLQQINDPSRVKRFVLPSTEGLTTEDQAYVMLDTSPTITADILDANNDSSLTKVSAIMLTRRIKEWNYTEPDGSPVPITLESVSRLAIGDLRFLNSQIEVAEGLTTEQKKTSSSISVTTPPETTTTTEPTPSQ